MPSVANINNLLKTIINNPLISAKDNSEITKSATNLARMIAQVTPSETFTDSNNIELERLFQNLKILKSMQPFERIALAGEQTLNRMMRINNSHKTPNTPGSVRINFHKSHQDNTHNDPLITELKKHFTSIESTVEFLNQVCGYPCEVKDFLVPGYNYTLNIDNVKKTGQTKSGDPIYSFVIRIEENDYVRGGSKINNLIPRGLGFFVSVNKDKISHFASLFGNSKITYSQSEISPDTRILPMRKENGKFFQYSFVKDNSGQTYLVCGSKFGHYQLPVKVPFDAGDFEKEIENNVTGHYSELQISMIKSLANDFSKHDPAKFQDFIDKCIQDKLTVYAEYCDSKHFQEYNQVDGHWPLAHLSMRSQTKTLSPAIVADAFTNWGLHYSAPLESFPASDLEVQIEKFKENAVQDYLSGRLTEGYVFYVIGEQDSVKSQIKVKSGAYTAVRMLREFCKPYLKAKTINLYELHQNLKIRFTQNSESGETKIEYLKSLGFTESQIFDMYQHFIEFIVWARKNNYSDQDIHYEQNSKGMGAIWRQFVADNNNIKFTGNTNVNFDSAVDNIIASYQKKPEPSKALSKVENPVTKNALIILSGLPGSGKTTLGEKTVEILAKSVTSQQTVYLEQDNILSNYLREPYLSAYNDMIKKAPGKAIKHFTSPSKLYHDLAEYYLEKGWNVVSGRCNRSIEQISGIWEKAVKNNTAIFFCNIETSVTGDLTRIAQRVKNSEFNTKSVLHILKTLLRFAAQEKIPSPEFTKGYVSHRVDAENEDEQYPQLVAMLNKMRHWQNEHPAQFYPFTSEDEESLTSLVIDLLQPKDRASKFLNPEDLARAISRQLEWNIDDNQIEEVVKANKEVGDKASSSAQVASPSKQEKGKERIEASSSSYEIKPKTGYYSFAINFDSAVKLKEIASRIINQGNGIEFNKELHVTLLYFKPENFANAASAEFTDSLSLEYSSNGPKKYATDTIAVKTGANGEILLVAAFAQDANNEPKVYNGMAPSKAHVTLYFNKDKGEVAANAGAMVRAIDEAVKTSGQMPDGVKVYDIDQLSLDGSTIFVEPPKRNAPPKKK